MRSWWAWAWLTPDILDVDGHLVISKDLADADRCDHRHLRRLRP